MLCFDDARLYWRMALKTLMLHYSLHQLIENPFYLPPEKMPLAISADPHNSNMQYFNVRKWYFCRMDFQFSMYFLYPLLVHLYKQVWLVGQIFWSLPVSLLSLLSHFLYEQILHHCLDWVEWNIDITVQLVEWIRRIEWRPRPKFDLHLDRIRGFSQWISFFHLIIHFLHLSRFWLAFKNLVLEENQIYPASTFPCFRGPKFLLRNADTDRRRSGVQMTTVSELFLCLFGVIACLLGPEVTAN